MNYKYQAHRAAKFFATQLCVTLIAWPLMLEWGLPVSVLSPIGNAIFNPFVTAFLALCALITGAEIINLPHGLLSIGLEQLTSIWLWIVNSAPPGLILTLKKPPLFLSLCAPIGAILIMHCRAIRGIGRKIIALLLLFLVLTGLFMLVPRPDKITVPYGSHHLTILQTNNGLIAAHDPGFMRRVSGMENWIVFTLLPQLAINFGRQQVDQYVCEKLTPTISRLLSMLCEKELIHQIILPPPPAKNSKQYKKMRDKLMSIAHQHQIVVT